MSTLRQIAASYGLQPLELSFLVGMVNVDVDAEIRGEQTATIINFLDRTDHFGTSRPGRHELRLRKPAGHGDRPPENR